ncbi:hypothetical protein DMI70_12125 [Escherichia coli]|nr:hypothetical protein [Escherichia coli]
MLSKTMGPLRWAGSRPASNTGRFHTLAILGLAVAMQRRISIWFYWSSVFLALGTVLFSGSLYYWRCPICVCGRLSHRLAA